MLGGGVQDAQQGILIASNVAEESAAEDSDVFDGSSCSGALSSRQGDGELQRDRRGVLPAPPAGWLGSS